MCYFRNCNENRRCSFIHAKGKNWQRHHVAKRIVWQGCVRWRRFLHIHSPQDQYLPLIIFGNNAFSLILFVSRSLSNPCAFFILVFHWETRRGSNLGYVPEEGQSYEHLDFPLRRFIWNSKETMHLHSEKGNKHNSLPLLYLNLSTSRLIISYPLSSGVSPVYHFIHEE